MLNLISNGGTTTTTSPVLINVRLTRPAEAGSRIIVYVTTPSTGPNEIGDAVQHPTDDTLYQISDASIINSNRKYTAVEKLSSSMTTVVPGSNPTPVSNASTELSLESLAGADIAGFDAGFVITATNLSAIEIQVGVGLSGLAGIYSSLSPTSTFAIPAGEVVKYYVLVTATSSSIDDVNAYAITPAGTLFTAALTMTISVPTSTITSAQSSIYEVTTVKTPTGIPFARILGGSSGTPYYIVPAVNGLSIDDVPLFANEPWESTVGQPNSNFDAFYLPIFDADEFYIPSPINEYIRYTRYAGADATGSILSTETGYWNVFTIGLGVVPAYNIGSWLGSFISVFFQNSAKQLFAYIGQTYFLVPAGGSYRIDIGLKTSNGSRTGALIINNPLP